MSVTHARQGKADAHSGPDAIAGFAARVLDVLVDRSRRSASLLRTDLVLALADGMVTQDESRIERTLGAFRKGCISPAAMVDVYVPAAARHLGAEWCSDAMSFADVTIATARLQALVRAIGTRWGGDAAHVPKRRAVLMVVPEAEDHTLGAVVAAGRMRGMGLSVCLRLGPGRAELQSLLRTRAFDAAMISLGHEDGLRAARKVIEMLRKAAPRGLPIVAGGAIMATGADVVAETGVDHATQDLADAIAFCGLLDRCVMHAPAGARVLSLHG